MSEKYEPDLFAGLAPPAAKSAPRRRRAAPEEAPAPEPGGAERRLVRVALDVPLRREFDYVVPPSLARSVAKGVRVQVPFAGRTATGFVVELPATTDVPAGKLKAVRSVTDEVPVLKDDVLELCRWVADYYACGLGEALVAAVPASVGAPSRRRRPGLDVDATARLVEGGPGARLGAKGTALRDALVSAGGALRVGDLLRVAEADGAALGRLAARGVLRVEASAPAPVAREEPVAPDVPPPLTWEQERALAPVLDDLGSRRFQATLLFGVTGSGKTEVYLRAIARALELGRSAIVLVPEIALTPQMERRFRARFGGEVAVLHSRQGGSVRHDEWDRVRSGRARVVLGPRSAVFAPVEDLGIVVVDEEHETSYKQEGAPRYHARDVALVRAKAAAAPAILGSATPSLESFENARRGRYRLARLAARPTGGALPACEIVDLGREWAEVKGAPLLSRQLVTRLEDALPRGERAILFVNRRGFTTFLHCPRCGHVHKCPRCDITLTYHKREQSVLCHFCHHRAEPPGGPCPACQGPPLRQRGAGTERVEEAFKQRFPGVGVVRLDTDALREGERAEDVLDRFRCGPAQVLVGTQMVAKGLDVPDVTVVGVTSADTGLSLPDFRAAERTFQLVAQVAGRAGRGDRPGRTVIQTFAPDHPAIALAAAHDYEKFAEGELAARRALGYPPFGRLLKVLVRGEKEDRVRARIERLVLDLRAELDEKQARILGPAPSPRAYLASRFRWQCLVKCTTPSVVRDVVAKIEAGRDEPGVDLALDVDPYSLL